MYSGLEGYRDGYFYHYKVTSIQAKQKNIHWIYVMERGMILALITTLHDYFYSFLNNAVFTLSLAFIFSFFHNGIYYLTRKKLSKGNLYPKGFWATSTTSQATLDFNVEARIALLLTGIIGIISSFQIRI